jgi:hypothetical protein
MFIQFSRIGSRDTGAREYALRCAESRQIIAHKNGQRAGLHALRVFATLL